MKVKLINTIELEPISFSKNEYTSPNGTSKDLPNEWEAYWSKSLSDSNIINLTPIEKGLWLVDIETIEKDELKIILKNKLEDVELLDYEDQVVRISGGISVIINGKIVVTPSCCGDLGNLLEWEDMIEKKDDEWNQLWIGHPWLFYKISDDIVGFSDYTDLNLDDFKNIEIKYQVLKSSLFSEILHMRKLQVSFENRIALSLKEMKIENAKEIAKLMTGN